MSSADTERRDEEEGAAAEDEDTGAQVAPIVRLEEVTITTGEEDEEVLLDQKAKLYRFDKDANQWKERGTGNVKLLKHRETGKVRLVMRQARTLKICANHLVLPTTKMQEHVGNDRSCVWHATDFSDGEVKEEMFCIRFGSIENCKAFMGKVEEIADSLGRNENEEEKEDKEANTAAELLQDLSVKGASDEKDGASKEQKKEEDAPAPDKEKREEPKATS